LASTAILERATILASYRVKIELEHVLFGLHDVAVLLHMTGRFDGETLDDHLTTVLHLRDDRIQRLDTFISDVGVLNEFFPRVF